MNHNIKIKQCFLIHIIEGRKTFEIRKNDRDYQVGDTITFLAIEDESYNVYDVVGSVPMYEITYIHSGLGMQEGYIVMSIRPIRD